MVCEAEWLLISFAVQPLLLIPVPSDDIHRQHSFILLPSSASWRADSYSTSFVLQSIVSIYPAT